MATQTARWQDGDGPARAEEIFSRLVRGLPLDGLGLGVHDGRLDLRGFVLPTGAGRPATRMVAGATWAGLDLTDARLPHLRFRDCRVDTCLFTRATCEDLRIWGTEFVDCDFSRARLPGVTLGTGTEHGPRNVWRAVDFTGAQLRGAMAWEAVFVDCDFSQAKIDRLEFRQCAFAGVRFAGRLRDVLFDGRATSQAPASPPLMVDLREAVLQMCDFRGCEFVDSRFPDDPDVFAVPRFPAAAAGVLDRLETDSSPAAEDLKAFLKHLLGGPEMSPDSVVLLNRRDFHSYPAGEELVALADQLLGGAS